MAVTRVFCKRISIGILIGAVIMLIASYLTGMTESMDLRNYVSTNLVNEGPTDKINSVQRGHSQIDRIKIAKFTAKTATRDPSPAPTASSNAATDGTTIKKYTSSEFDYTYPPKSGGEQNSSSPTSDMLQLISLNPDIDRLIYENALPEINFLPDYKNPCWYEPLPHEDDPYHNNIFQKLIYSVKKTFRHMKEIFDARRKNSQSWRLRCLPYFYIPGISKCGTTDLYGVLAEHPEVAAGPVKEPVFWNRIRWNTTQDGIGWLPAAMKKINNVAIPRPVRDYIDLYDKAAETMRTKVRIKESAEGKSPYHYAITGDGTPSYLYDFDGWVKIPINKGLSEPKFTIAESLYQLNSKAKIILIFRDPAERLFSDYKYFGGKKLFPNGRSKEDFHARAQTGLQLMKDCLEVRTVRSCVYDRNLTGPSMPVRVRIGMYYQWVKDWLKVFPKENVFITRLEDYSTNEGAILNDLYEFLDIEQIPMKDKKKIKNRSFTHPSLSGGMLNKTRDMINEFYDEWNIKLAELLQDDRFLWRSSQ